MSNRRIRVGQVILILVFFAITFRLFYWQVLARGTLQSIAKVQYQSTITIPASRGAIQSSDGFPLVTNQPAFLVFAYTPDIEADPSEIANKLAPLLAPDPPESSATPSAILLQQSIDTTQAEIATKLNDAQLSWIPLTKQVDPEVKQQIEAFDIKGIGFEEFQTRYYPEASMAAQILGFVGSDGTGKPKGYFGLEGYYDLELAGRSGIIRQEKDAQGRPIIIGNYQNISSRQGRSLTTHIDRGAQLIAEKALLDGLNRYGASAGEVVIMDPQTGSVLAIATAPTFNPLIYKQFDPKTYKLSSIADTYEPGSTFKVIVMAAAIDDGVIKPDTICQDYCSGPVTIGKYTIKTWNDEYHPGQTAQQILERSDNTGMIFVANKLGKKKFANYLNDFGIGQLTGIDLEGETASSLRETWGDIDLATGSFGQGLAVTSIQMLTAVSAIANGGEIIQPQVVKQVASPKETDQIQSKIIRRVISQSTAEQMKTMMVASAEHGEARWIIPEGYQIAGKTGTAQIPIAGHYDTEKTIASFVGFVPAHDPKFAMLVKLKEPQSSPWASETAAPLWFSIANDLLVYYDISPQMSQPNSSD